MTTLRRWTGSAWEDALALPGNIVTTDTDQTIGGIKTFSSAPVVPDGSWTIADTAGLQTALDSKYSAANPPPGGTVDLSNYVTLNSVQTITAGKTITSNTIPIFAIAGPAGATGMAAMSIGRANGTIDAWVGTTGTTKFFTDDVAGDMAIRVNYGSSALRIGFSTNNTIASTVVMNSGGVVVTGNVYGNAVATNGYNGPSTFLGVQSNNTGRPVAVFKLASGQTADFTQWHNNSGTVMAKINNTGSYYGRGVGLTAAGASDTSLSIVSFAAQTTPSALVKLGAGQTGNAVEVQDSNGVLLSRIGPDGAIYDNGNRVYSAANPPPGGGTGGTVDLSNYVTLNGAETLTGAKTLTSLLTSTGIAATGTVGAPLISGYSSVISITPSTDAQDGLLIKVPTATYGTNVAYGEGQPIQVLTDGAGTGQAMVRFRVDRYGAVGTTGGLHISPGSNSSTYAPTQALWIQPLLNNVIPQITDGFGDTDIAWFRNAAVLVNSAPKNLLKIKANGVTEVSENVQAGTAYPGIQQVTVGSVFGVAGVYFGSDALLYRPAAVSQLRCSHDLLVDKTVTGTTGVYDGTNRVYSAANPPPGTVGSTGKELGYAEKTTADTTTNTVLGDTQLAANTIAGLSITLVGTGTPVEVEVFVPNASHSAAGQRVYAILLVNGVQANGTYGGMYSSTAGYPATIIVRRRIIIPAGQSYTFTVGKFITGTGTGTYTATATAPMYISAVQR